MSDGWCVCLGKFNFGYEVWGLGKSQDIKRIQLKCYKQLLKSKLLVWVYMVN